MDEMNEQEALRQIIMSLNEKFDNIKTLVTSAQEDITDLMILAKKQETDSAKPSNGNDLGKNKQKDNLDEFCTELCKALEKVYNYKF